MKGYWNVAIILAALGAAAVDASARLNDGDPIMGLVVAVVLAFVARLSRDTDGDGTPDVRDRTPEGGQ